MADRTCTADGCIATTGQRSTYCSMHYFRMRRNGTLDARIPKVVQACLVADCTTEARYTNGMCKVHWMRDHKHGSPLIVKMESGSAGPDHASWRADDVGYQGAHTRVRTQRGRASQHSCVDCGSP